MSGPFRSRVRLVVASVVALQCSTVMACGLKGASIPIGTPIQELTISGRDRPTLGFGASPVTRISVVARPCHGTLVPVRPTGFRYTPDPGFVGRDMYAVKGCMASGQCGVTGAAVTVTP